MFYINLPCPLCVSMLDRAKLIFSFVCVPIRLSIIILLWYFNDECTYRCRLFTGIGAFYIAYLFYWNFTNKRLSFMSYSLEDTVPWFHQNRILHAAIYFFVGFGYWANWSYPWALLVVDLLVGCALVIDNNIRHVEEQRE